MVEDIVFWSTVYGDSKKFLREMIEENYGDILERSWVFRTVGYGHSKQVWNDIISTLKAVDYDGSISIEHEDALMSPEEGLEKAIEFLKEVLITKKAGEMWWA